MTDYKYKVGKNHALLCVRVPSLPSTLLLGDSGEYIEESQETQYKYNINPTANDCELFVTSKICHSCENCPRRHCPYALNSQLTCSEWKKTTCNNNRCSYRHNWEDVLVCMNDSRCNNVNCLYKHTVSRPRLVTDLNPDLDDVVTLKDLLDHFGVGRHYEVLNSNGVTLESFPDVGEAALRLPLLSCPPLNFLRLLKAQERYESYLKEQKSQMTRYAPPPPVMKNSDIAIQFMNQVAAKLEPAKKKISVPSDTVIQDTSIHESYLKEQKSQMARYAPRPTPVIPNNTRSTSQPSPAAPQPRSTRPLVSSPPPAAPRSTQPLVSPPPPAAPRSNRPLVFSPPPRSAQPTIPPRQPTATTSTHRSATIVAHPQTSEYIQQRRDELIAQFLHKQPTHNAEHHTPSSSHPLAAMSASSRPVPKPTPTPTSSRNADQPDRLTVAPIFPKKHSSSHSTVSPELAPIRTDFKQIAADGIPSQRSPPPQMLSTHRSTISPGKSTNLIKTAPVAAPQTRPHSPSATTMEVPTFPRRAPPSPPHLSLLSQLQQFSSTPSTTSTRQQIFSTSSTATAPTSHTSSTQRAADRLARLPTTATYNEHLGFNFPIDADRFSSACSIAPVEETTPKEVEPTSQSTATPTTAPQPRELSTTDLYIRNLPVYVDDERLRREFEQFGVVTRAKVMRFPDGNSKKHAFVNYTRESDANQAMSKMQGCRLHPFKNTIVIEHAYKHDRPTRTGPAARGRGTERHSRSQSNTRSENNNNNCAICLDNPADTVVLPCGHICMCMGCATQIKELANECPVCRGTMENVHKTFRS